jgi:tetratricopeptide (TPR) repeat protein
MNKKNLLALAPVVLVVVSCIAGGKFYPFGGRRDNTGVNDETLIRYARAQKSYREGGFSETIKLLQDIRQFVPALVLRGKAEYFSGEPEAAERSFRRARKHNPASAEAGLYLGRILRERGDRAGAEALAEALLADDPLDVRVLRLAADLAWEGGKADSAIAYLDRAAEASAESALVFVDRARARWTAGKGQDALEDLAKAQVLLPWDTPLARSIKNLETTIREALR